MPDCDKVLEVLKDGEWHHVRAIMGIVKPGAINFACRSRISDLKKKGFVIESKRNSDREASYRLVRKEPVVEYKLDATGQTFFV